LRRGGGTFGWRRGGDGRRILRWRSFRLLILAKHRSDHAVGNAGFTEGNNFRSADVVSAIRSLDERHDDVFTDFRASQLEYVFSPTGQVNRLGWCRGSRISSGLGLGFKLRGSIHRGVQQQAKRCRHSGRSGKAGSIHSQPFRHLLSSQNGRRSSSVAARGKALTKQVTSDGGDAKYSH
jgi:hypothetical protein